MQLISSWGNLYKYRHEVYHFNDPDHVIKNIEKNSMGIAYGNGRSYGDVCLNPGGMLWHTRRMNRFCYWNPNTGILCCEAGVLLQEIQQLLQPRGWLLPVTPGTQLITIGGAIANDIHGKNHHVMGSFGEHVLRLWLVRTNGELIECGPRQNVDWFVSTVGGIGLTGVIVRAELQLRRVATPWMDVETIPYDNLDDFFTLADDSEAHWEHTVAWIDCLSDAVRGIRGIFQRANNLPSFEMPARLSLQKRERKIPFTPPVSMVNNLTLKIFNKFYYNYKSTFKGRSVQHYEKFLYPLDELLEWNRVYGTRGFYQYQSVVPPEVSRDAIHAMLHEISHSGEGSFLAVLKTFGKREPLGMLSFARQGTTLALDFPNKGSSTEKLFQRLDSIVMEAGGAIYLAKDARMPNYLFRTGYPKLNEFLKFRDLGIRSGLSCRLLGDNLVKN